MYSRTSGSKKKGLLNYSRYTFIRDARVLDIDGVRTWVVMVKSEVFESAPEKSGVVRVKDYVQTCCMQSDGKNGSKGDHRSLHSVQ